MQISLARTLRLIAKGETVGQLSPHGAELLFDRHLDVRDSDSIAALLVFVRDSLDINLHVVGGAFGCTKLYIDVDAETDKDKRELLFELINDEQFAAAAVRAGFAAILIREPYVYKTLTTGVTVGQTPEPTVNVFVSRAREDAEHSAALGTHLASMVRQRLIRTWTDDRIAPGEDWRDEIHAALRATQLFLLLVSADYIASDFCSNVELPYAVEQHKARRGRLLPIIVRPVDLEGTELRKYQALPTGGRAVTLWRDRDEAWVDVARQVRRTVRALRQT